MKQKYLVAHSYKGGAIEDWQWFMIDWTIINFSSKKKLTALQAGIAKLRLGLANHFNCLPEGFPTLIRGSDLWQLPLTAWSPKLFDSRQHLKILQAGVACGMLIPVPSKTWHHRNPMTRWVPKERRIESIKGSLPPRIPVDKEILLNLKGKGFVGDTALVDALLKVAK